MKISILKPAVDKKILVLIAGLMWCGIGLMLMRLAVSWLLPYHSRKMFYLTGFLFSMPIHYFGFLKIANKNLKRLLPLTGKKCIFSFMTWRSYLIVLVMISLGIVLRHSSIPKDYISVIYIGIGLGLFLSGLRYIRFFINLIRVRNPL